jgi:16S rRNA (guanine527-N7)-methyltransferase
LSGAAHSGFREQIAHAARQFGAELSEVQLAQLALYAERVLAWNERINLSGARDLETLAREHVADALALLPHLPRRGACVDVGSGAGLPGLVLAIVRPDLSFLLLEPSHKRRAFLAAISREVELRNASVSGERLESLLRARAGCFEFAVARAVFPLSDWLSLGAQLVGPGGLVAGMAGGSPPRGLPPQCQIQPYDVGAGPRLIVTLRK